MNEPTKKDGIWIKTNHTYQNVMINQQYTNRQSIVWNDRKMPYNYENGHNDDYYTRDIVKFRNKLYVIIDRDHVVFDGNALGQDSKFWVPYSDETTAACELNDYLYWFITEDGYTSKIYRYDGSSITNIFNNNRSHICRGIRGITIYNNKILYTQQYDTSASRDNMGWVFYDGNAFTSANYRYGSYLDEDGYSIVMSPLVIFVLNGNLYYGAQKGYNGEYYILKYNGAAWDTVCNLGNNYAIRDVCVSNNEAYLLCDSGHNNNHIIKYTGNSTFVDLGTVSFGNVISELNGNLYTALWDDAHDNSANHFLEGKSPEKVYNPNTVIINKGDAQNGAHLTNMFDTSYMIGNNNNRFVSGFDDCYYFADTSFDWNAPMYYGNGSQWIKFKN